jgi:hypothetical protein
VQNIIKTFISPADSTASSGTTQVPNPGFTLAKAPPGPYAATVTGTYATTSYAANGQVFGSNSAGLPRTFVDGTSNTIMFAERAQVCTNPDTTTWSKANTGGPTNGTVYNFWGLGVWSPQMPAFAALSTDNAYNTLQIGPATPLNPQGTPARPTFTTATLPVKQGKSSATAAIAGPVTAPSGCNPSTVPYRPFQIAPRGCIPCDPRVAQTPHVGGMLTGMGDGSVRVVSPTISDFTYWAAVTPAGSESLGPDW